MTKIYWIKLLISQIARECFLKAVRLESKLSSHLQTTGTWAQGEPLYMSLMQSLAETRDYTWVAVNSMQHFLYWKGVDARSMFEEWLTMRLNSWKKDCTKRPSNWCAQIHILTIFFLLSLPLKRCILKSFCGPSSRRASSALINTNSSPQKPLGLEHSHWLLLLAQCWCFSAYAKPHWWDLG